MNDRLQGTSSLLNPQQSQRRQAQTEPVLNRLKQVETSSKERRQIEQEQLSCSEELEQAHQDIDTLQARLIRERQAVIELVDENTRLREICRRSDQSIDSSDRITMLRAQYETLLKEVLEDHKVSLSKTCLQRDTITAKLSQVLSRCEKLEILVQEGSQELLKVQEEKKLLEFQVDEMQTTIEQRIQQLRKRLNQTAIENRNLEYYPQMDKVRLENQHLKQSLEDCKV